MPIKGLTDRASSFPRLGILRKGAPKQGNRPGQDLSYFRFDTDEASLREAFTAHYGQSPDSLEVYLPYASASRNFSSWMEEWKASSLIRRCDGEQISLHLTPGGKSYSKSPLPCQKDCACKPSGKLSLVLPKLGRLGYVEFQTHSRWDIIELHSNLLGVEQLTGDLRGIPFLLRRVERSISTPRETGRARAKKWLCLIEVSPAVSRKILNSQSRMADRLLSESQPTTIDVLPQSDDEF